MGVGPDVLVGLFVERSAEMIVGLLGILKAGGAYVPMDAAFPQERITFMLADANVKVLLTQTSLLASLPAGAARAVCLDTFDWNASERPAQSDASRASRKPCLRDLYQRLDRPPQGRLHRTPEHRQLRFGRWQTGFSSAPA